MRACAVVEVDRLRPDPACIARAADVLRCGGLVAFPTETVYGLGADACNADAVARVFAVKGRPPDDPIIVHVAGSEDIALVASAVPRVAHTLAEAFWPGPLTLVVPRGALIPDIVTAGLDSVAVRAPSHPVARALISAAGRPVAAPSANLFGRPSPTTAEHVVADLGDRIDLVLDAGPTDVGVESTVVDCRADPPVVLRPGGVTVEALAPWAVVLAPVARATGPQRSPGTLARHYSPRARVVLVRGDGIDVRDAVVRAASALARSGHRVGLLLADEDVAVARDLPESIVWDALGALDDHATVARRLFASLRALDARHVAIIVARDFGEADVALAVRDRLTRAADGRVVHVSRSGGAAAADEVLRLATG